MPTDELEVDEGLINDVSSAEELAGEQVTKEEVIEAIQAIDAVAAAVLEDAGEPEKEIDIDELLSDIEDAVKVEDEPEELPEEEKLPTEIESEFVRVIVSDDGVEVEKKEDEVYDSNVDDQPCTVLDTCEDYPVELVDEAEPKNDDLLIIGNSKSTKFKKGYVALKSSASKKAWSAAYKTVREMIGSSVKMTAAHWVIVSAIASKIEAAAKRSTAVKSAVVKAIKSNANLKAAIKSSFEEIDKDGATAADTKPTEVAGKDNPGFEGTDNPATQKSPEDVTSQSGNPVNDPDKDVDGDKDKFLDIPDAPIVDLEIPLNSSKVSVQLKKIDSSRINGTARYVVSTKDGELSDEIKSGFNGKVSVIGKETAVIFKDTPFGLLACAAHFVKSDKGNYTTIKSNGKIQIAVPGKNAEVHDVFSAFQKKMLASALESARKEGATAERKLVASEMDKLKSETRQAIESARKVASAGEDKLRRIHAEEERERLFQSSQKQLNAEKQAIKSSNARNGQALADMYSKMF